MTEADNFGPWTFHFFNSIHNGRP